MRKATQADAHLLLELERLKFSPTMEEAFAWFSREIADSPVMSHAEFLKRFPRGSEGFWNLQKIGQFYETMGTIARYGLIDLDLIFDRYGVQPFWKKLSFRFEQERKDEPNLGSALGENFEWLAKQNEAWLKKRLAGIKSRR